MRSLSAAWLRDHLQILVAASFASVFFVVCSEIGCSFQTQAVFENQVYAQLPNDAVSWWQRFFVSRWFQWDGPPGEAKKNFKEEEEEPQAERKTLRASWAKICGSVDHDIFAWSSGKGGKDPLSPPNHCSSIGSIWTDHFVVECVEMCGHRHQGNSYTKPKTFEGRFNKRFGEKIHEIDGKRIVAATGRTGAGGARHLL